jgi:large subunit ribosomal protein L10
MEKIGRLIRQISEKEIRKNLKEVDSFFVVGYSGLSSSQMNILRQSLKARKSKFFVIKNSISKRVFEDSGLKDLSNLLQGPCGLVFIKDDIIATSKILYNFAKEYGNLKIEGGILKERVLNKSDISVLASLPRKDMLYTKIALGLKSPIYGFVFVLSNILKKFVIVLDQVKNKKSTT